MLHPREIYTYIMVMSVLRQSPPCLHHMLESIADCFSPIFVHVTPSSLEGLALNQGHVNEPLIIILSPAKDLGDGNWPCSCSRTII